MSVVDLAQARAAREARAPHVVGRGRCVGCGHEAVHVVPLAFFEGGGHGTECARCRRRLVMLDPIAKE